MRYSFQDPELLWASLTIEAALLMPIIFATVFSCVFLTFQYHNSAAMTANAAETAITGKEQELPNYVGAGTVSLALNDKKRERISSVSGRVSSWLFPGGSMTCTQTYQKIRPARTLRRIQAVRNS